MAANSALSVAIAPSTSAICKRRSTSAFSIPADTTSGSGISAMISRGMSSPKPSRSSQTANVSVYDVSCAGPPPSSGRPSIPAPGSARMASPPWAPAPTLTLTMRGPPKPPDAATVPSGVTDAMRPLGTEGAARLAIVPMGSTVNTVFRTPSGASPPGSSMRTDRSSDVCPADASYRTWPTAIPSRHADCHQGSVARGKPPVGAVDTTVKPCRSVKETRASQGEAASCR